MLGIILTVTGVVAIFLAARAFLQEGRWARAGAIIMPVGLVVAAVGALLWLIPDFFASR